MRKREHQRGFTLIELLTTVAIMVVFLAISVVAVGSYRSKLKITELDNAARQIYLAAQNRAVLLHSRGALEPLLENAGSDLTVAEDGSVEEYSYITNTNANADKKAALDQLLPVGTIDPSLREGQFYIVYEPDSGSVTDAFYMEDALTQEFPLYYATAAVNHPSADDRRKAAPMVGWYSAKAAEAGGASYLAAPEINIINEDTLRAEITWSVPKEMTDPLADAHLKVTVTYGGKETDISDGSSYDRCIDSGSIITGTATNVYLLDSLVPDMQFKDLFTPDVTDFGKDFTIRAEVVYTGADAASYIPQSSEKTTNSLFADGTTDGTAHIAYLRHLQNLDKDFSGVDGITAAVQDEDINKPSGDTGYTLEGTAGYSPADDTYNFQPINNPDLTSYDGQEKEIRWLHIDTDDYAAGLFADFGGDHLTDIHLMNADVSGNTFVGALCGEVKDGVTIDGCQVYWKAENAEQPNLRTELGEADKTTYALNGSYKLTGDTVGGLVGSAEDVTINNSFAATTVSGDIVGGLVGQGNNKLTIERSYADCYLAGSSAAAGLVGSMGGTGSALDAVYSAGFISRSDTTPAAGLYLGSGADVTNSYAAMAYSTSEGDIYPLSNGGSFDDGDNVYYLGSFKSNNGGKAFTTADELELTDFLKAPKTTYAYNLRTGVTLGSYPYPGLENLDHYGDWPVAAKQSYELVYWEQYDDVTIGIMGLDAANDTLKGGDAQVVTDGYALLLTKDDYNGTGNVTMTVGETTYTLSPKPYDGGSFYLAELPAEFINLSDVSGAFYYKLDAKVSVSGVVNTISCWYNPHFAMRPIEADGSHDDPNTIYIRSARHLYNLSRYFADLGVLSFEQQLNIDYGNYTAPDGVAFETSFCPIGTSGKPFNGTYNGWYHYIYIWNAPISDAGAMGLFGYNSGIIQNVFFGGKDATHVVSISGSARYMGALVGVNNGEGRIENCAVGYVELNDTSAGAYVGGLVGQNNGIITNCSASTDAITANGGQAGGFVGLQRGSISNSYAISRISAATASGFAAECNGGSISNSYAAADVTGSGTKYAFAPDSVISSDCYYLDKGIYLGTEFTTPEDSFKTEGSKTWDELTNNAPPLLSNFSFLLDGSEHKLPAIVKADADGNVIFHYGNTVLQAPDVEPNDIGVYYWEQLNDNTYCFRVVGYTPGKGNNAGTYSEQFNNLRTAHDDGHVITAYGYGWFISNELGGGWNNKITLTDIYHEGVQANDWCASDQEINVSTALAKLMGMDADEFHSFPTAGNDSQGGLYLNLSAGKVNGTVAISHDNSGQRQAVFEINPFFANAINYDGSGNPSGLGSEDYPYEIRSVRQLQFINWNGENCNSYVDVSDSSAAGAQFPYLRSGLAFRQTHDLDGKTGENSYTAFFPIAAWLANNTSDTYAAFGGAYDGQSYAIKNIDIADPSQQANTVGLFGATLDAHLRNIILFSEKGDNTITINNTKRHSHRSNENENGPAWYVAGTLAGLSMQTKMDGAVIENCAAAGFTINDYTVVSGEHGGTIGGLVGATNAPLNRCAAVNDIYIGYTRDSADPNDVRVGGLVGACENTITSCYSGGGISVSEERNIEYETRYNKNIVSLYIGRMTGGVDMKLDIDTLFPNDAELTVKDCYSYVTLPEDLQEISNNGLNYLWDQEKYRYRELYNIAGNAELVTREPSLFFPDGSYNVFVTNCYHKDQDGFGTFVKPNNDDCKYPEQVTGYSYEQMRSDLFNRLSADMGYRQVDMSYSPDIKQQGDNYPFPAVLTRDGKFIHYGEWPNPSPVSTSSVMAIDLFADYDNQTGTAYQDNLVWATQELMARMPGGQFRSDLTQVVNAEGDENAEPVCTADFVDESDTYPVLEDGQRVLRITFHRPGDAEVTVFYGQPWADISDCVSLTISVTDTAELHMQPADTSAPDGGLDGETASYGITPESVTAFAGASTELKLYPFDRNNDPIAPALMDKLSVTLTNFDYDGVSLTAVCQTQDLTPDTEAAPAAVMLDGVAATNGVQTMTVEYSYTIEGMNAVLTGSDDVHYEVGDLTAEPDAIVFVRLGGSFLPGEVTYGAEDILFTINGEDVTVDDLRVTSAVSSTGSVAFTLNADGSVTAAPGNGAGLYALDQAQLDLTFTYGPASHSVTVSPLACFYEDGMTLHLTGGDMDGDGSVDLYAGEAAAAAVLPDEAFYAEPMSVEMTDMPDITAAVSDEPDALSIAPAAPEDDTSAPAPGVGTPVRVVEYLDEDWTVQWSLEGAVASYVSLAPDGSTAWLNVTGMPETNLTEGMLTVTVTLPAPWLGVTFTGSVPVRLINENAPAPTPEPVPEVTPVPEYTAPPAEEITPAPPVEEPEWQPEPDWPTEWEPEPVPDAPDVPDMPNFLPEDEFIP